jgi:hypothetical protein
MARRVLYSNRIVRIGFDPRERQRRTAESAEMIIVPLGREGLKVTDLQILGSPEEQERVTYIRERVSLALSELGDDERELIERFYYSGETIREIAERSGRAEHRLELVRKRALRRLRKLLKEFVKETFGVGTTVDFRCPICDSAHRTEIDEIIRSRDRTRSWRPVMREVANKFQLTIVSPMTFIGHEKYH